MKSNPMAAAARRGQAQFGTWVNMVRIPAILPLLKAAGLDFARIDMEHSGPSIETVGDLAILARALDFPIAVRPPKADRQWVTRLLDMGVWNIHCPQIENAEHAAEIVAASRYAPWGYRGNGGLGPSTDFETTGTVAERRAFANENVFINVMFETGRAFDDLDKIAAMKGIDAITVGPADLAQDLGVFGKPEQKKVLDEHRDRVVAACKKHGKIVSMMVSSAEEALHWKKEGALLLVYSTDVDILHAGFSQAMAKIKG